MCGLFGAVSNNNLSQKDKELSRSLGIISTIRGEDSTGVLVGQVTSSKKKPSKIKLNCHREVCGPSSFFASDKTKSVVSSPLSFILGHSRATTIGEINLANAQPFVFSGMGGAHNGTIQAVATEGNRGKDKKDHRSDSYYLLKSVDENGLRETLEDLPVLNVAYALSLVDFDSNILTLTRNDKRPLSFMSSADGNKVMWASVPLFLEVIASLHSGIKWNEPVMLEEYELVEFNLAGKPEMITRIDGFAKPVKKTYVHNYTGNYSAGSHSNKNDKKEETSSLPLVRNSTDGGTYSKKDGYEERRMALHKSLQQYSENSREEWKENKKDEEQVVVLEDYKKEILQDNVVVPNTKKEMYMGFGGRLFMVEDIEKKISNGCAYCQESLTLSDHISWATPDEFFCETCMKEEPLCTEMYHMFYPGYLTEIERVH